MPGDDGRRAGPPGSVTARWSRRRRRRRRRLRPPDAASPPLLSETVGEGAGDGWLATAGGELSVGLRGEGGGGGGSSGGAVLWALSGEDRLAATRSGDCSPVGRSDNGGLPSVTAGVTSGVRVRSLSGVMSLAGSGGDIRGGVSSAKLRSLSLSDRRQASSEGGMGRRGESGGGGGGEGSRRTGATGRRLPRSAAIRRWANRWRGLPRSGSGGGDTGSGRWWGREGLVIRDASDRRARGVGAHGVPSGVDPREVRSGVTSGDGTGDVAAGEDTRDAVSEVTSDMIPGDGTGDHSSDDTAEPGDTTTVTLGTGVSTHRSPGPVCSPEGPGRGVAGLRVTSWRSHSTAGGVTPSSEDTDGAGDPPSLPLSSEGTLAVAIT